MRWNYFALIRKPGPYLPLENYASDCIIVGVTENDQRRSYAPFCCKSFGRSRKNQKGFAALFFANIDVAPAHRFAYPGAERFCHCLFARETCSQMALREFHRHRIFNLTICEHAMQEPVSESFDGTLDARAFDNINANTNHAHLKLSSR